MKSSISILGCGWLGIPLAHAFIKEGYAVKGSATSEEKKEILNSNGIEGHLIRLGEDLSNVYFFSSSILIVAVPPRRRSQEGGVYKAQIKKTIDFIQQQQHIKHVIYTSSTSVYKDEDRIWKEEDLKEFAETANEELFEIEQLFLSLHDKKISVLRLGGLTGGTRMLAKHFAGRRDIAGGTHPVNLVHLEDVVSAIQMVVKNEMVGVYNICSSEHPSKKVFYTQLCERFTLTIPAFQYEEAVKGKIIDSSKIQEEGFKFKFPNPFLFTYED